MKDKTPPILTELVIMLLVFALSAALCLRAFVWADAASQEMRARDEALLRAQNAAEVLKSQRGDMARAQTAGTEILGGQIEQGLWYVLYDQNWKPVDNWTDAVYCLNVQGVASGVEGLRKAQIWVDTCGEAQTTLCSLPVAWQEVASCG